MINIKKKSKSNSNEESDLPDGIVAEIEKSFLETNDYLASASLVIQNHNSDPANWDDQIYVYCKKMDSKNVRTGAAKSRVNRSIIWLLVAPAIAAIIALVFSFLVNDWTTASNLENNESLLDMPDIDRSNGGERTEAVNNVRRSAKLKAEVEKLGGNFRTTNEGSAILTFQSLTDSQFTKLGEFFRSHDVASLELNETSISDKSISLISQMNGLEFLYLQQTQVTSKGIRMLENLKLTELQIHDTAVGNDGITTLPSTLTGFMAYNTQITDDGMHNIAKLTNLRNLFLGGNAIGDPGIRDLRNLQLQWLDLTETYVTDKSFSFFPSTLKKLELDLTRITDEGLTEVHRLRNLTELKLSYNSITDKGILNLLRLERLNKLEIKGCPRVTDKSLMALRTRFPEIKIDE